MKGNGRITEVNDKGCTKRGQKRKSPGVPSEKRRNREDRQRNLEKRKRRKSLKTPWGGRHVVRRVDSSEKRRRCLGKEELLRGREVRKLLKEKTRLKTLKAPCWSRPGY